MLPISRNSASGKDAILEIETLNSDKESGRPMCTNSCQNSWKLEFGDMDHKYLDGVSPEESQVREIKKTCADYGASKTFLWRGVCYSNK
ncbi:hypothetical protein Nepgr_028071 [Nepenthes gracilis]|uniref:Uncharacterized protein n=1 Tax=Nepenthes gracilis TaxID=150966 RepID=A0AAD3TBN5_NEPGR|nr:hypothetical protein Nepgr_028071 [Nepenthes gracilis]